MESAKYLSDLEKLPGGIREFSLEEIVDKARTIKINNTAIDGAIAAELGLEYIFDSRNVSDNIFDAYNSQYPNLSELKDLYSKALEENPEGISGLVSGIKGKLFEINLESQLESQFPGYDFEIPDDPTQPIWDLKGVGPDGHEIFVQAKMGAAEYADEVRERMLDNPDVLFATSTEIHDKILSESPELADHFINTNVSNTEFTDHINEGLDHLLGNFGIDFPDGIDDLLPYVGEIIAGIRLLIEINKVKRDFDKIEISERRKIQGLRAIMAISRFGINAVLSLLGGASGSAAGPLGSLVGGLGGLGLGIYINKKIKPHLREITLGLMDLDDDELLYFRYKDVVDNLGKSFYENRLLWT